MITDIKLYVYTYNRSTKSINKKVVYAEPVDLSVKEQLAEYKLYDANGFSLNKYIYRKIVDNPDNHILKSIYRTKEDDAGAIEYFTSNLQKLMEKAKLKYEMCLDDYESVKAIKTVVDLDNK